MKYFQSFLSLKKDCLNRLCKNLIVGNNYLPIFDVFIQVQNKNALFATCTALIYCYVVFDKHITEAVHMNVVNTPNNFRICARQNQNA